MMDDFVMPPVVEVEPEPVSIPEDHPIRTSDRYGPGARLLRRWSLNDEGLPVCTLDALDTLAATAEQIAEAEAANAAVRVALDVPEPEAFVLPVPQVISPLQARRALLAAGLLDDVEAMLAQAPREAQLAWEYAIEVRRDDATLAAMAGMLGLTAEQVDDLFRVAGGAA